MKQKTLKKSARFISILLNIGCIIFGILSVSLLIGIMVIVFLRKCSVRRGELLFRRDNLLALGNAYSSSFVALESLSVSF